MISFKLLGLRFPQNIIMANMLSGSDQMITKFSELINVCMHTYTCAYISLGIIYLT